MGSLNKLQRKYLLRRKEELLKDCKHTGMCECRKVFHLEMKKVKANIPFKYINFELKDVTHQAIKTEKELVKSYIKSQAKYYKEGRGLYMWGQPGLAKTALGTIILSYALRKGYSAHYIEFQDLAEFYTKAWDFSGDERREIKEDYDEKINHVDFLMIDNLGQEIDTKINPNILEKVIRFRVYHQLPIIYTSNKKLSVYCRNLKSSSGIIHSLFAESIQREIEFQGADFRKTQMKG